MKESNLNLSESLHRATLDLQVVLRYFIAYLPSPPLSSPLFSSIPFYILLRSLYNRFFILVPVSYLSALLHLSTMSQLSFSMAGLVATSHSLLTLFFALK